MQSRETSTVYFKSVGVTRDVSHQQILNKAFLATEQGKLCVKLTPEPDNPYETHAVVLPEVDVCLRCSDISSRRACTARVTVLGL